MPARDAPEAADRRDGEPIVKTKVDPTAENEVELTVEIPAETVQRAYDRLVAKVRGDMQLPGFRKGRVPMALVIQPRMG
jgi:trigger factor